ncbi:hypothetical protein ACRQ84_03400 [Enterobacter ludwigii]
MNKLLSLAKVALLYVGEQWNNAGVSAWKDSGRKKSEISHFAGLNGHAAMA